MKLINNEMDEPEKKLLNEITEDEIKLRIFEMEETLSKCVYFCYEVLDSMEHKVKEIINT